MENLLADHQDGKTNQVTDAGICEEEADGTSEVDAQVEQKLIATCSEEVKTPQSKHGVNEYPTA